MTSVVFLDRDGTIIEDVGYLNDPSRIAFVPGAIEGIKLVQKKGYPIIVVSNQSGVGRGLITDAQFKAVHNRMCELLKAENIEIASFNFCFHHPEDLCGCRKPKPGLIPREIDGDPILFAQSYVVGDRELDCYLAESIRANGCLLLTGHGPISRTLMEQEGTLSRFRVCENLVDFASKIPFRGSNA